MSHGTDIFILGGDKVVSVLKEKYPEADMEMMKKRVWLKLAHSGYQPSPVLLREISIDAEIIWICISSPTDYFEYAHWNKGLLQRELLHEEGWWSVVKGQPEPWEHDAFFPEDVLRQYPSYATFGRDNTEADKTRCTSISIIEQGSYFWICSKDSWSAVVSHFNLLE